MHQVKPTETEANNRRPERDAVSTDRAFLTLIEAAQQIGCTRRFLETRIDDGELIVFRPSKRLVRIKRTEFERWVESYSAKRGVA